MKNYLLGFFLNSETNYKVRKIVGEVGRVFDGQDIDVRWVHPDKYHVLLMSLGSNLNLIQRTYIDYKIKKLVIPKFYISFDRCELGTVRTYKDLVYITVKEGGESLRDLVFLLRNKLGIRDTGNYIPQLTLGRVSKDLTSQEVRNIAADLQVVNNQIDYKSIKFYTNELLLIENDEGTYKVLRKVLTS